MHHPATASPNNPLDLRSAKAVVSRRPKHHAEQNQSGSTAAPLGIDQSLN